MAAGMGSRFGGIKQIAEVGPNGELIIDYSVDDAIAAGFTRIIFVIRRDIEKDFCEAVFNRISKKIKAEYVFQDITDIPAGFTVPNDRTKPWGTGHAVLAARHIINEPFCVINADDYYGPQAFKKVAEFFKTNTAQNQCCTVGYKLINTLSEKGTVSRGTCIADSRGYVVGVRELLKIQKQGDIIIDHATGTHLAPETDVLVNFFGLKPQVFELLQREFVKFLEILENKYSEFFVPVVLGDLVKQGEVSMKLLTVGDKWLGITYPDELEIVRAEIVKARG